MADYGTATMASPPFLRAVPEAYLPVIAPTDYGVVMLIDIPGYVYAPPTVGQLWPRGDYTPYG